MGHSTIGDSRRKKPVFPLWLHSGTGQWCKKIRGINKYFGTDQDKALERYMLEKADLEAGRIPKPPMPKGLTLTGLANHFLTHKTHQVQTGELSRRSFEDYYASCDKILKHFGKDIVVQELCQTDLMAYRRELAKTLGPARLGNEVNRTRIMLNFAFNNGLIERPIQFGEFKRPKKVAFRRLRAKIGSRMIEPPDLKRILDSADVQLRAMILLGLNAGFGNADCGTLPIGAVDLKKGWIEFPRPKTGVERRVPLWQETILAIKEVLESRKTPNDGVQHDLLFVTKFGASWHVDDKPRSAISAEFRKLIVKLKLYQRGRSFYTLRHIFQTVAEETGDETATKRIMGHADGSMSDHYRERFPDARLLRVVQHVHDWVFPVDVVEGSTDD